MIIRLEQIQPVHIRQYLDSRKQAPVRANREKALFSHIWNKAREWGYTDKPNPCQGVQGHKESGRDIYVEDH
ncbi:MAG: integrase, partial [Pseudomonadota bacterium]|nr:integrase [Pseudomonadota bacterium]